jgi:hypothetical protein
MFVLCVDRLLDWSNVSYSEKKTTFRKVFVSFPEWKSERLGEGGGFPPSFFMTTVRAQPQPTGAVCINH